MKKMKIIPAFAAVTISAILLLSGCGKSSTLSNISGDTAANQSGASTLDTEDMFTDRDFETGYDQSTATKLTLSDENPNINITSEGTYVISGAAEDGTVTVNAANTEKVQIVLNGVTLNCKTSAALYVKSADKVFVTLVKGTQNTLSNGGTFGADDSENIDGVIFSKSDITFNGEGTLTVKSPAGHGIVGKDDVKFTSGTYVIESAAHGVDANDSIRVSNSEFTVNSTKDGMHCDNEDDASKGYVYIKSGTFTIDSDDDAVHAITTLQIDGGTFTIKAAEGLEATRVIINGGTVSITASDDGINAAKKSSAMTPLVEINGGKITIVMGQGDTDGIDSNGDIVINGGTVDITGNSSFDYDGTGVISGGTVTVNGEEVTTLPNQFAGGGPGGMRGGMPSGDAITSATPPAGGENGDMPAPPDSAGEGEQNGNRQRPGGTGGNGPGSQNGDSTGNRPQNPPQST